ncbi:MAG: hypothetical protein ACN6O2_16305 [Stenotrophomonas sp.]|uniref:hypothetical protein n=1 Tax=Stenotrophomonas sp. TaxID=69392 RepID=UPI0028AB2AF8|nr:hypothetical protein [Stenotrophomonas sp.]
MQKRGYWFQAKTHGIGWGWPLVWQGWFVYGLAAVLLVAGFVLFPPSTTPIALAVFNGAVILALLLVCWLKGEPLRLR